MTARTMTARTLFPLAMLAILAGTASTAEAVCQNNASDNYRRLLVAQPPDIFFKAGVPATQEIPVVFVTYRAFGAPQIYNDCGATAVSSITGVSVEGTSSATGARPATAGLVNRRRSTNHSPIPAVRRPGHIATMSRTISGRFG